MPLTQLPQNAPAARAIFSSLKLSATGANANVSVSADDLVLWNGSTGFALRQAVALTINSAASGAGGLDTGALAASTWYAVYVIGKSDGTTAGLLSLSATAPTMPAGYTFRARVGWMRTDGTANKYPLGYKQDGRNAQYTVGAANVAAMPVMASGAAGSAATPTWAAIGVGNFVPPTAARIRGTIASESSYVVMIAPNASYGSYASATNPPAVTINPVSAYALQFDMALESSNIYWANNGAGRVHCGGWEDNL